MSVLDDLDLHTARLIPAVGIGKGAEQEERATSALLAVMTIVPSFGKKILKYLDAPGGKITTYTEPHLETRDIKGIPDGLIHVRKGKSEWVALLEVKTGKNPLKSDQINRYLQLANGLDYNAMLTISNEIVADPSESPVSVDRRRSRRVRLAHLSWSRILTEAVIESEHRGVDDPEQAWILNELIAYLDNEKSGASGYEGMGKEWVQVRVAAKQQTLDIQTPGVKDVANDWEQFVEYLALRLRQRLGGKVEPIYPREATRDSRLKANEESLRSESRLEATIRVPDAAAPMHIEANLASRQVTTSARISGPSAKERAKTRVNWILRQLKGTPKHLRIEVHFKGSRTTVSNMVETVRDRPELLLFPDDPKRKPTGFTLALTNDMGNKKGKTKGSFVQVAMDQTIGFYRDVLQKIEKYVAPPRKLSAEPEPEEEPSLKPGSIPAVDTTTDTDGDGLSDHDELHVYKTDPMSPDTDGDGVSDTEEIFETGTDPIVHDN